MVKDTAATSPARSSNKRQSIITLLAFLFIMVVVNIISSFLFTRFDLTTEKRYSLSPATKQLVRELDDVVYFKVYLEGDFPASFKRLRNSTREMLDEMRAYANGNIQYEFINPSTATDSKEQNEIYRQLVEKGLQPTDLQERGTTGTSNKIVFPGAIVNYLAQEQPLSLLKNTASSSPEQSINNSIQNLEYEIANTIRKLTKKVPTKIAFIEDYGTLDERKVFDITRSLAGFYNVERKRMDQKLNSLDGYKVIVIAKPDSSFDEKDKFIIDQYVMRGGKVLWLLDGMVTSMDSLQASAETMALAIGNNLDDQLFRYGVRVNPDLILDLKAAPIPIVTGYSANKPIQSLLPWYYFPLLEPGSDHPIVKNLNAIKGEFTSSIDTVGNRNIKKTVLLTSSKLSRTLMSPVRVSINIVRDEPDLKQYNKPHRIAAVLMEGEFSSVFENRLPPVLAEAPEINFRVKSIPTAMIVVSDGDIIENKFRKSTGGYYPLGYDRYTNQVYGNKNFLLNCIDYLSGDSELLTVRTKEFKLRLLDRIKTEEERTTWQVINTVLPILFIILFGVVKALVRKRRYAS